MRLAAGSQSLATFWGGEEKKGGKGKKQGRKRRKRNWKGKKGKKKKKGKEEREKTGRKKEVKVMQGYGGILCMWFFAPNHKVREKGNDYWGRNQCLKTFFVSRQMSCYRWRTTCSVRKNRPYYYLVIRTVCSSVHLMDNKYRKLSIVKLSKRCKFMPIMYQNKLVSRAVPGPAGGA